MRYALLPTLLLSLLLLSLAACGGTDATGEGGASSEAGSAGDTPEERGIDASTSSDAEGTLSEDSTGPDERGDDDASESVAEALCSPEENEELNNINPEEMMGACIPPCVMEGAEDLSACVGACFAESSGLSPECSSCFGDMSVCIMGNCSHVCPADPEACPACAQAECDADLKTCLGVEPAGEATLYCLNTEDQLAVEMSLDSMFEDCIPACYDSDEQAPCVEACAAGIGLSTECSGCFADLGACAQLSCNTQCSAETANSVECKSCMKANCEVAYYGCSGLLLPAPVSEPEPAPELGACDGEEDAAILGAPDGILVGCTTSCEDSDDEACVATCLSVAGVSEGCTTCLDPLLSCQASYCAGCTANPEVPGCDTCIELNCAEERDECFSDEGSSAPGPDELGACLTPEDSALLDTFQQTIGTCTNTCIAEADASACMTTCFADAGFSMSCAECMSVLLDCTVAKCGPSCSPETQAQDGGAACQQCSAQSCGSESQACFGDSQGPGVPDPGDGPACVNPTDDALLASDSDPDGVCAQACQESDDQVTCLSTCLVQAGFSEGCAVCLGALSGCVNQHCSEACNSIDAGDECAECVASSCAAEQSACYQGEGPGAGAMCSGDFDQEVMASNPTLMETCSAQCLSDPGDPTLCITNCLTDLGLSGECSGCISWFMGCTFEKCAAECSGPGSGDACGQCAETQCAEEMATCYGESSGGGSGPGTGPDPNPGGGINGEGLCMNNEDGGLLESQPWLTSTCGQQCFQATEQSQCVGDCLMTKGLSEDCAYCMGDLVACSMSFCLAECMGGGPECELCSVANCAEESDACYAGGSGP